MPFQSAIDVLSLLGEVKTPTEKLNLIVKTSTEIELNSALPT